MEMFNLYFKMFYSFDKYCDFKDIIYDMTEWILQANLTFQIITQNTLNSVFIITGAVNNALAEILDHSIPITDLDAYEYKYEQLGKSVGSIVQSILGFNPM
mmetsp:Transcript_2777/g.2609  ORF Transcript_2777/g.2609 Transcript_2777/m.2609 type:complete len:101 (+) Transcript_2777:415-717(+)